MHMHGRIVSRRRRFTLQGEVYELSRHLPDPVCGWEGINEESREVGCLLQNNNEW